MALHYEASTSSSSSSSTHATMTKVDPLSNAQNEPRLDAGNKHHDHYANALPKWRNEIRKKLIPIVRWETPYLALMQDALRTPALDSYFAFTANLGTHTFYMVFLPILFWCGYTNFGRAMVHMLAAGIFVSGFLKDMLCLPRPLSPPLARITMSGSAALEYGFPSSHSTNAVSVALYAIYMIRSAPEQYHPQVFVAVQALFWWYAISIIFGRLYCGMHGFLDVVIGSILGAIIGVGQLAYGDFLDTWIPDGPIGNLIISILVVLVLVRIHPEPADDCPCFDDSVSFAGVVLGIQVGAWQYARCAFSTNDPISSTVPFSIESIGWVRAVLRVILGVVMIFIWRASTKPALFKILPPLFRVLERVRWNLPRAFFLNASKYTSIPTLRGDDNVIPTASELPHMLKNLAHPRRRSVSVGPQSAADAYETLAYRNRRRRESINSLDGKMPEDSAWVPQTKEDGTQASPQQSQEKVPLGANMLPTPMASRVHSYEQMMGTGNAAVTTATPPERNQNFMGEDAVQSPTEEENEKREIFMKITKPRVRYDVEVVTKLIVYAGIGWLAVSGNPMLFQIVGLGMGVALVQ